MIKSGDKVKGFKFSSYHNSANLHYTIFMDILVGEEGIVVGDVTESFSILYNDNIKSMWSYPTKEYIQMKRDERLKELGI